MTKLEIAKRIIKTHYDSGDCGIFDCRNVSNDDMFTLYSDDDICVDICYRYAYFEVFGLSDKEFKELEDYYNSLGKELAEEIE